MSETVDAGSIKNNNAGDWIPSFTPSYFIGPVNQAVLGPGGVSPLTSAASDNSLGTPDTSSNGN